MEATTLRTGRPTSAAGQSEADLLEPGRNVGRFTTLGAVGQGATGVVYRAYDPELDRRVALKVLRAGAEQGDVLREARAMARLRHPNVVTVFDVGTYEGSAFVAMEYVEGTDVATWLERERPSLQDALRVMASAGRGLAAAHAAEIVHRDFKASNVLVGEADAVYVVDFGLAQVAARARELPAGADLLGADADDEAPDAWPAGTPGYLAPELYAGTEPGAHSDLFAYAVTLWQALYRRLPWAADDEAALLAAKRRGPPALPAAPRLPRGLGPALRAALDPDPARRPQGVASLIARLEPQSRRSGWVAVAALAAVGVGAAAYAGASREGCTSGPTRTAEVWDDTVRTGLARGVRGSGVAHAAEALQHLEASIDGYVETWQAAYRDACEATHFRREQSAQLLDQRVACLDRKLAQLSAALELLQDADPQTVANGARGVAKLEGALRCGRRDVESETDEARGPEADAIRRQLDRIEVLEAVAQYDEAMQLARAALEEAQAVVARGLALKARYRIGRLLDITGDAQAAVQELAEVHWAAEAGGWDALAAKAGIYVEYEHAAVFNDPETALAWAPHVEAAVERAGGADLDRAAHVENVGLAYLYKRDYDRALEHFQRSLILRESATDQDHLTIVASLGNLGIVLEEMERYDEALANHERALGIVQALVGEHHPHTARVIDNMGTTLLRKGDMAAALERFGRALEIRRTVLGPEHRSVALSSVHFALASLQQGDYDAAVSHYSEALRIYGDEAKDHGAVVAHEGLAHAYAAKKRWPEAHEHARIALEGLEGKLPPEHAEIQGLKSILAQGGQDAPP